MLIAHVAQLTGWVGLHGLASPALLAGAGEDAGLLRMGRGSDDRRLLKGGPASTREEVGDPEGQKAQAHARTARNLHGGSETCDSRSLLEPKVSAGSMARL